MKGNEGDSPLDLALRENKLDIVLYIFTRGFGSDEYKHKVLIQACKYGGVKEVKELVEQHNVNPKGAISSYAIQWILERVITL